MIEFTILNYLSSVSDVPWYLERPEILPVRYGLIERTGSSKTNQLNRATVAIQTHAPTMAEVIELNHETKKLMEQIITLDRIASCKLLSDYNFTDVSTKTYRYQAVYDLVYYSED